MQSEPIVNFIITPHAEFEMRRRGLSEETVSWVLQNPEQSIHVRPGRFILQSRLGLKDMGKAYLIRVFVDVDRVPSEVVTVYKTSKILKYWRDDV